MSDQNLVDNIRKETYIMQISQAFDNSPSISLLASELIKTVQVIYRYLEPSHFDGKLIVYKMLDDTQILNKDIATKVFDKNLLIGKSSGIIVLQITSDDELLLWENVDITDLFKNNNALFYCYENKSEYFYANDRKIDISNNFNCSSIYALHYHYLNEALNDYKINKVLYSSCEILKTCWHDRNRIFFKNKPEETMQKSLKDFLSIYLRGVDAVREYTLGARKPVDIRIYWKEANRAALIELKWLGKSKKDDGKSSTGYTNSRASEGIKQLKEYIDLDAQDTPTCITKGYLVVIDGRRNGTGTDTAEISHSDGLHYQDKELTFPDDIRYFETIKNFEKPIRMFAKPICN